MRKNKTTTEIEKILEQLGLNEKEVLIYLAALELGECTVKQLSDKTKINRTTIYLYIDPLKQKGFLSEIKKGARTSFLAEDPRDLVNIIDRQKSELKAQMGELDVVSDKLPDMVSELMQLTNSTTQHKPHVKVYEGAEGVRRIYQDMVKTGSNIYCWTDIESIEGTLGEYTKNFIKDRVKAGITSYAVMPQTSANKDLSERAGEMRNVQFRENMPIKGEIRIYGDKVAVISFDRSQPIGFVFQSSLIAELFKTLFKAYWEKDNLE